MPKTRPVEPRAGTPIDDSGLGRDTRKTTRKTLAQTTVCSVGHGVRRNRPAPSPHTPRAL